MGWFEDQIKDREEADQQLLEDSYIKIAGVVLGERAAERIRDDGIHTKNAIDEILKYYHCKTAEIPKELKSVEEQLRYCLRPHGLMFRGIELKDRWYADTFGPVLATTKEGGIPVALLPRTAGRYVFRDPAAGRLRRVNSGTAALFEKEAICFYRPLPQRSLGIRDLVQYMWRCLSLDDMVRILAATLAMTLTGLFLPRFARILTGPVVKGARADVLLYAAVCMICITLSYQMFSSIKGLIQSSLGTKISLGVEASMMMRILSLPASFFRQYGPGEMISRSMSVKGLCQVLTDLIAGEGLTSLMSLLYIVQIFHITPMLGMPSLIVVLVMAAFSFLSALMQADLSRRQMEMSARESGMSYSMITGIQKIRLAGAEKRIFARWLDLYAEGAQLLYNPPLFLKLNSVISTAISLGAGIALYGFAVKGGVDQSSYLAFSSAYGMLTGAFLSMSASAFSAARILPMIRMAEPFLKTAPESAEEKEIVTEITGEIELDHVTFRYTDETPYILNDLSLKINPGEYIAVVGKTGCGKSTLVRLLLGFEQPEKGSVYYDGKNLQKLDISSLRRKIGTVMQDAGLFQGDIYSNIVISAPELGEDDAWDAAEKAGIADDIRAMPMGMHTLISEGRGGISGGQRQRIMIARAIAPKPKVLIFDEATSALDNKTQKQVSDSLEKLGCTRLVIAHRLSTIRSCDRILVLEDGRIVEDGTYEELVARGGFFAELVRRQQLDEK